MRSSSVFSSSSQRTTPESWTYGTLCGGTYVVRQRRGPCPPSDTLPMIQILMTSACRPQDSTFHSLPNRDLSQFAFSKQTGSKIRARHHPPTLPLLKRKLLFSIRIRVKTSKQTLALLSLPSRNRHALTPPFPLYPPRKHKLLKCAETWSCWELPRSDQLSMRSSNDL